MEMRELHWLMNLLTQMDVGIVVFDLNGKVRLWNSFMANHSGISPTEIQEQESLFDLYPVFKEPLVKNKLQTSLVLDIEVFINWEQMPHLFDFSASRPITSNASKMYQNITITTLKDASGKPNFFSLMVYDVTDIAISRLALQQANNELEKLSRTDKLTGLSNRSFWQEGLASAVGLFQRYQTPHCLIMFDIDHFKKINDGYGHLAGDLVIREIAALVSNSVRNNDCAGRYGGEEFGIILPETDLQGTLLFAERLRQAVAELTIQYQQHELKVTISLGVAQLNTDIATEQNWIEAADQALYAAKNSGRNCVRHA